MSELELEAAASTKCLRWFALSAAANCLGRDTLLSTDRAECAFLLSFCDDAVASPSDFQRTLNAYLDDPVSADLPLLELAEALNLTTIEILSVALAVAVEDDVTVGRAVAFAMSPIRTSRPTLGLLTTAVAPRLSATARPLDALLYGNAHRTGLVKIDDDDLPIPEQVVRVPAHLCAALHGSDGEMPRMTIGMSTHPIDLPPSIADEACSHALTLARSATRTFVVRGGAVHEAKSVADLIARTLNLRPLFIETEDMTGLGPWLRLRQLLPVHCFQLAPGERKILPHIAGYSGVRIVLTGVEGTVDTDDGTAIGWRIPAPTVGERRQLWQAAIGDSQLASELARQNRHRCGRIAELGRLAHYYSRMNCNAGPDMNDIYAASCASSGGRLDALAQSINGRIDDEALVMTPGMKRDLHTLVQRCLARDGLADGLGVSATARYHPGVRTLFVGPSGTGKTLAALWVATRLGLPLYRVDLAAVTSKYIGETEKNLSQLFARAEESEIVLLFDEADSLFGKRTEVQQANDRHANAQTNYLLQRVETFDGIVILTSNSRSRFDPAFTRRLDVILEFPHHGPQERRKLWRSHLGKGHQLTSGQINRLAATADLSGGNIRNVVLAAAASAKYHNSPIGYAEIVDSMAGEYRKLGRQMPMELKAKQHDSVGQSTLKPNASELTTRSPAQRTPLP